MSDLLDYAAETAIVHELKAPATTSLPEGWPENGIPPHPFAALNRLYDGDERQALRASLIANGLREKIVMYEDKILDGRNRYLECVAIGRFAANVDFRNHPDFVVFGGDRWDADRGTDPLAFVWDMDVRRHRSAKDTALAAARYLRFIAELKPEFPDATTAKLRLPTQAELAKRHGISERLVHSALMLLERAEPEVVKAVDQGTMSLTDAADVVSKLAPEEQRVIAAAPDRKSAKRAVKAAKPKARKAAPAPELPSPMSRQELATFAEEVAHLAWRAAYLHKGTGASISADAIIRLAAKHGVIDTPKGEKGKAVPFTRQMQLALGRLRDFPDGAPKKAKDKPKDTGPTELALGGQWTLRIGGFKGNRHQAVIEVFHEADDTYSVADQYTLSTRGGGGPFRGSYPSFQEAISGIAGTMLHTLDGVVTAAGSGVSDADRKSAAGAAEWLREKLAGWAIEPVFAPLFGTMRGPDAPPPEKVDLIEAYTAALAAGREHAGKHTIQTAEPILRAGVAADVKRQKMADDMNAPLGSIKGWCGKLGLQDHARLTANAQRLNAQRTGAALG